MSIKYRLPYLERVNDYYFLVRVRILAGYPCTEFHRSAEDIILRKKYHRITIVRRIYHRFCCRFGCQRVVQIGLWQPALLPPFFKNSMATTLQLVCEVTNPTLTSIKPTSEVKTFAVRHLLTPLVAIL